MKVRTGYMFLIALTLILVVIMNQAFDALNQPSDFSVGFGYVLIGSCIIFCPYFYKKIWTKFITPKSIETPDNPPSNTPDNNLPGEK